MKEFPFDPYDFFGYLAAGLVILVGLDLAIGVPPIVGRDLDAFDAIAVALAAYIIGQIVATPAQWALEDIVVSGILKRPSVNLMRKGKKRTLWRFVFPGYCEPLPPSTQERILRRARNEQLTDLQGEMLFLHIRFRDYIRDDTALIGRLNAFLNKYGFNRNLCFVALVFAAGVLSTNRFDLSSDMTRYGLLALAAAVLLFYRYLKFLRQYSYELFNSYAGNSDKRPAKGKSAA